MPSSTLDTPLQAQRKAQTALARSVPVTRMVDYGVPLGDALAVHQACAAEAPAAWDLLCEDLGERHVRLAREHHGSRHTAAHAWRAASALFQCSQLAFHEDSPRKAALYERAQQAMQAHGQLAGDVHAIELPTPHGSLFGWVVQPTHTPIHAAVVVLGGLSGWGSVYLDMGRALAARGLLAVLAEGPGQGLSRLRSGLHVGLDTLPLLSAFVDCAVQRGARSVGTWGNSFGGLFASHLAVNDARIDALCVNGAPMQPEVPGFRTAREQLSAAFGTSDPSELAQRVERLSLHAGCHQTQAAILVLEGGSDELVAPGSQAAFFGLARTPHVQSMRWDDGQHTLYNHAQQRNDLAADWFSRRLHAAAADRPSHA